MKTFIAHLRGALVSTLILSIILCGLYPMTVWAIGQFFFPDQANGSLIVDDSGTVRGSRLIGQNFQAEKYFQPRPSAAGTNGYDAVSSSGSNLGPTSQKLADQIKERLAAYRFVNGLPENAEVPADAVTASGSGLDPHISLHNAGLQIARVARVRNLSEVKVRELVSAHTDVAGFGILGQSGVNVLELNLALDGIK